MTRALRTDALNSVPAAPVPAQEALREAMASLAAVACAGVAQALTLSVMRAFWTARAGTLPLPPPPIRQTGLDPDLALAATRYGESLAGWSTAEAGQWIGTLYTSLLPEEQRARHGMFHTPAALAERLTDQAEAAGVDWRTARVLDPAAGAAALLLPVAARMVRALADTEPSLALQSIASRLRGWELDPFSCWLGNTLLEVELLDLVLAGGRRAAPMLSVADSLAQPEDATYDLLIGNPPYGRITLAPKQRTRFARSLYGHANLYGVFMDLALRLTKPDGVVSFLTPSSFLAGDYFRHLRETFARVAPPVTIDLVEHRKGVFAGVLQETVLATYRKTPRAQAAPAAVSVLGRSDGGGLEVMPLGPFDLPRIPTEPWLLPRHAEDAPLAARLRTMPARLADWGYRVRTGPLVWNRHKPQLLDARVKGSVPVIWAESITRDGRFVWRCDKQNHRPWLRPEAGDDWLIVRSPCVLLQRTTAKEQARRLIAAELPAGFLREHGGVTVENHVNMLVPTGKRPPVSLKVLAAFLNSRAADRAFRCLSGSVAVSAFELEAMPLPGVAELRELSMLVAAGAGRGHVENAVGLLYGVDSYDAAAAP